MYFDWLDEKNVDYISCKVSKDHTATKTFGLFRVSQYPVCDLFRGALPARSRIRMTAGHLILFLTGDRCHMGNPFFVWIYVPVVRICSALLSRLGAVLTAAAVTRWVNRDTVRPDSVAPVKALRRADMSTSVHSTPETWAAEFHRRQCSPRVQVVVSSNFQLLKLLVLVMGY